MDQSILITVKKMLGIDANYEDFDTDIIMSINSAIHTLYQVGYVYAKNFIVEDTEQTWGDLAPQGGGVVSLMKSYIYCKVRTAFDPPTSSFVLTSLENQTKELEWRIYAEMEGGFANDEEDNSEDNSGDDPEQDSDPEDGSDDDNPCGGYDPWEGVPGNGDESELPDTLRRLRNEVGRP